MIKAIIFDFDGTILDTETTWYNALCEGYQEHGASLSLDLYSQCIGTHHSSFDPYTHIEREASRPVDLVQFKQSINEKYQAFMKQEQIREGVLEWLKLAKVSGLLVGLATSSHRNWIDRYAGQLGIIDYFDCICTADDVSKVKPDPELYKKALEGLGVKADEAIAVEDSPNGARAAIAAGIKCLITPNPVTRDLTFDESPLCYFADSVANVDFEAMRAGVWKAVQA